MNSNSSNIYKEYFCYSNYSEYNNIYHCSICGKNYYEENIYKDDDNNNFVICNIGHECYNYKENNDYSFNLEYFSCKTCHKNGGQKNPDCLECETNFISEIPQCENNNDDTDKFSLEINSTEPIQKLVEQLLNNIDIIININNQNDIKISNENYIIIFTSTENQKNNEENNNVTMYLGECEYILKDFYNISHNDSLYLLQIIKEEEGMKIPKVEYEAYYPLYNFKNLTKLNLTLCKDTKI